MLRANPRLETLPWAAWRESIGGDAVVVFARMLEAGDDADAALCILCARHYVAYRSEKATPERIVDEAFEFWDRLHRLLYDDTRCPGDHERGELERLVAHDTCDRHCP